MFVAIWVLHLSIVDVISCEPIRHFNEVVFAKDDTTSISDRADNLGVFGRHEAPQDSHAERRAKPTRCVAVLYPQWDTEEGGGGTGGARLVRISGRSQHSGFIDCNEGVQIRIPASAVQERGRIGF